jgi:signal transduction histidine kinase
MKPNPIIEFMTNRDMIHFLHDVRNKLSLIQLKHEVMLVKSNDMADLEESKGFDVAMDRVFELLEQLDPAQNAKSFKILDVGEVLLNGSIPQYKELEKIYHMEINLSFDLNGEDRKILCNLLELKKARENIIENAFKAGASIVNILYKDYDNHIEIIFKDNGSGICPEMALEINQYKCDDEILEFSKIGTKVIKHICSEHGFSVNYSVENGQTTIKVICPYLD